MGTAPRRACIDGRWQLRVQSGQSSRGAGGLPGRGSSGSWCRMSPRGRRLHQLSVSRDRTHHERVSFWTSHFRELFVALTPLTGSGTRTYAGPGTASPDSSFSSLPHPCPCRCCLSLGCSRNRPGKTQVQGARVCSPAGLEVPVSCHVFGLTSALLHSLPEESNVSGLWVALLPGLQRCSGSADSFFWYFG